MAVTTIRTTVLLLLLFHSCTVALYYAMFIYTITWYFHVLSYELTPKCHCGAIHG